MKMAEALALVGGYVGEEILKRNEYLEAENEILRSKLTGRISFTNAERIRLAKLGNELGRKALEGVAGVESPGGISPPGAHRTGREPLDSSGSYHPAV